MNDCIGSDQRATKVSGSGHNGSVGPIANGGKRNPVEQDIDRIRMDLKVCRPIQLFGPAAKRNGQSNCLLLYQTRDFFEHGHRHNNGMFSLIDLLKDAASPSS